MQNIDEQQYLHFPSPPSTTLVHHTCAIIAKFLHQTHSKQAQSPGGCRRTVEGRSGVKVWKKSCIPIKEDRKIPSSDLWRHVRMQIERGFVWAAAGPSISPKTQPTSSAILPLTPLLWIIVNSHGHKSEIPIITIGPYLSRMFPVWLELLYRMRTVVSCYLNHSFKQRSSNLDNNI